VATNRQFQSEFPTDVASIASVRSYVRSCLSDLPDVQDDAVLAASELATNAVEHGSGVSFLVEIETTSDAVDLSVESQLKGPWSASIPAAPLEGEVPRGGRGLRIVAALADSIDFAQPSTSRVRAHCRFVLRPSL
jgi:anti-sigma regulatory factor (Ser/Thr protein kinase)